MVASRLFRTPAHPSGSGPDFVNCALRLHADLAPADILAICHQIESDAARDRDRRWGPRTLDIDLIACDDLVLPDELTQTAWRTLPMGEQMTQSPSDLILPHPRMQDRAFVLVPLAEVAPDWRHPVLGLSVEDMLARCPASDRAAILPLEPGNPLVKHSLSP